MGKLFLKGKIVNMRAAINNIYDKNKCGYVPLKNLPIEIGGLDPGGPIVPTPKYSYIGHIHSMVILTPT